MSKTALTPNNQPPVRFRAFFIGLFFAIGICIITPYNNIYRQATPIAGGHFPLFPFYIFLWLCILSAVIQKITKSYVLFSGMEMIVAFALMLVTSGIAYTGLTRTFFINLTAPFHFSTIENRWEEVLNPLLPNALFPNSKDAIEMLYNGIAGGRKMGLMEISDRIPWSAWITPLLLWSAFIFLSYFVMLCIVSLLTRQTHANERMNFPLLEVPQLLAKSLDHQQLGGFLSNRFLLMGISIPLFLHLLNGLNTFFPSIPQIPTLILAGPYFPKTGLFSGFAKLKIFIYPAFIGFAFLASKQISFSFWFFFLMGGIFFGLLGVLGYHIPSGALGITFGPTLSRPEEMQMVGACVVFFLFLMWMAREHFQSILKASFFIQKDREKDGSWVSLPFAFWGAAIGFVLLSVWLYWFGVPMIWAPFIVGVFFMFTLVATRVICQGGVAYFTLTAAPMDGLISLFGPHFIPKTGLVLSCIAQKVLFVDLRESLMASIMHAQKLTHRNVHRMAVLGTIIFSLLAGVAASFIAMLILSYKYGIRELRLDWATRTSLSVYNNLFTIIETPRQTGDWVHIFILLGAVIMFILIICYHRFYWWPLHPIGYFMTYSSAMRILWFSFFMGWLLNALCMRYGGAYLYKKIRFFFVGLILGDFFMGGTWAIIGLFSDMNYHVLPL